MKTYALVVAALLASGLVYAESARTLHSIDLHADAQSDAATLGTVPENTAVEILQRRGAWNQIKAGKQTGWVKMFDLKADAKDGGAAPASGSGNPVSGLKGLLAGRTSNSGTETNGARGFTDIDLDNAQPNMAEFQNMQKLAVDKKTGTAFGQHAKLTASSQPYFADSGATDNSSHQERN
jgi:hypothetical protein